jgi:hypothetical protein
MKTTSHSNLPVLVIFGLILLGTLIMVASLANLHVGPGTTGYSAPVLFNQANAAAQQGKTGQAIADYERAHLLAPNNADIAANLQWVREHADLPATSSTWIDHATSWASPNTMAFLGWLGLVLTGAGILSARSFSQFRSGFYLAALTGISLLLLSALSATAMWQKYHEAVVISPETAARISPVTNGETSFKLQPGETVTIEGRYNDFALVQNSAGHSGWIAQNDITPLIPN